MKLRHKLIALLVWLVFSLILGNLIIPEDVMMRAAVEMDLGNPIDAFLLFIGDPSTIFWACLVAVFGSIITLCLLPHTEEAQQEMDFG